MRVGWVEVTRIFREDHSVMTTTVSVSRIFAVLLILAASVGSAFAQGPVGPEQPANIPIEGCFEANQNLFGDYRLNFCFDGNSYTVVGGETKCAGALTWTGSPRGQFDIELQQGDCNGRAFWERASLECRPTGGVLGNMADRIRGEVDITAIWCTYFPSVRGKGPRTFTATRQ